MQKRIFMFLLAGLFFMAGFSQQNAEPSLVIEATYFDKSPALTDMPAILTAEKDRSWKEGVVENKSVKKEFVERSNNNPANAADGAKQVIYSNTGTRGPEIGIEGIGNVNFVYPPDTDGDVGPNHYFQMINLSFAIWDKQGNKLYGPVNNSTIWQGFVGPWTGTNDGDPIVLYDEQADRWLATQFAVNTNNGINYQLIAVSETGDPLGAWYRYAYAMVAFNDYPKFSVWNDGYYATWNMFGGYTRVGVGAFERDKMLVGDPTAKMVYFDQSGSTFAMLPADFDGTPPPAGAPCYFIHMRTFTDHKMEIYEFDVDWNNTSNSSFSLATVLTPAAYSTNVGGIPQPNTSTMLDDLAVMLMYRLQYRNFGTHESMVVNHTVSSAGKAAPRWYELRKTTGDWSIYQQGTFAPDIKERWMGSIAMNANGDIALGYSLSSTTTFPSIAYTGRRVDDPLGQMTVGEVMVKEGLGSQTNIERWGDYSAMSVDPADDTTFWFTTEYRKASNWGTYITSFNLGPLTQPTAYAGADTTICVNELYPANGTVTSTQSVLWTTTGDGFFQSPGNLNTFYLRGNGDISNGQVTLALTAYGFESGWEATDSVVVYLSEGPLADAGSDTLICTDEVLQLSGTASGYNDIVWRTSGDGSFSDTTVLDPIYSPGTVDIATGNVVLTMLAIGTEGCVGEDSDEISVTIDECTGLDEPEFSTLSLGIRPNPNNGVFTYEVNAESTSRVRLEVLNVQGQIVFTQLLGQFAGTHTGTINIGDNPKGIYYLRINNGQAIKVQKVLVQ
ncbi:MAG: T9SS type A sorting domain-containing protein [Bacteroidales bacterium]|nr:T9SS type A sorting domain-containing protein [Bacteroidales bacterium]